MIGALGLNSETLRAVKPEAVAVIIAEASNSCAVEHVA